MSPGQCWFWACTCSYDLDNATLPQWYKMWKEVYEEDKNHYHYLVAMKLKWAGWY